MQADLDEDLKPLYDAFKFLQGPPKTILEKAKEADPYWVISEDGNLLTEHYPGYRSFNSAFWALLQPLAAFGFLVVGVSTYVGQPIVDMNPITQQLIGFLRPLETVQFFPQGIFMCFYGFFGLFLFGPPQWYAVIKNYGYGLAQFNKEDKSFVMIKDGELIYDIKFDEIDKIKLRWAVLTLSAPSEVFLKLKDGREAHFCRIDNFDPEKWCLERRAFQISEMTGKKLDVTDFLQADPDLD